MNDLKNRILELQHQAHELLYLGTDGAPVYSDRFSQLNKIVLNQSDALLEAVGSDLEEEANLCLALLMGYSATVYDYGDKEQKKQTLLNRASVVLEQLPDSVLKVKLLTYCYGEVYEEALLQQAHAIINSWDKAALLPEQAEAINELKNIEDNPYPWETIEEG